MYNRQTKEMDEPLKIGEWVRISHLGEGGFGVVTLWKNQQDQFIAVKKCRWMDATKLTERQKDRWRSEVKMMETIKHENIVSHVKLPVILDIALNRTNPTKLPLLSMEYCSKGNLRRVLNLPENGCGLPESEIRALLSDLSNAVSYLHHLKITHRDIKPENIVLQYCNSNPNRVIYKIIDLGYAKEIGAEQASFVGTLQYLAPEIFQAKQYDYKVDYWSLGLVVFEAITAVHPFLPAESTPVRFEYLRKKEPEHIYLYYDICDGKIKYSRQLPLECHVSRCFREGIEKWLRLLLQFKPSDRGTKNGLDIFQELKNLLEKKVVKVFSVYDYNFYFYQYDENTTLVTLQDWFAQDSNIPREEQVLVGCGSYFVDESESWTVSECISNGSSNYYEIPTIYILKRGSFVNLTVDGGMPKLVKQLFKKDDEFKWDVYKSMNYQVVFYLTQECEKFQHILTSFELLTKHLQRSQIILNADVKRLATAGNRFIGEISCYSNIRSALLEKYGSNKAIQNHKSSQVALNKNLLSQEEKLKESQNIIKRLNKLVEKSNKLHIYENQLDLKTEEINSAIRACRMDELYEQALVLAQRIEKKKKTFYSTVDIHNVVNKALKNRHNLVSKIQKNHEVFFRCLWEMYSACLKLNVKIKDAHCSINLISKDLRENHLGLVDILMKNQLKGGEMDLSSLDAMDVDAVLRDNVQWRYKLQDLLNNGLWNPHENIEKIDTLSIVNGLKETEI